MGGFSWKALTLPIGSLLFFVIGIGFFVLSFECMASKDSCGGNSGTLAAIILGIVFGVLFCFVPIFGCFYIWIGRKPLDDEQ
jgi:hypothetical protein